MPLTPERHTAEPAQPVSGREGFDAQGAPVSGQPEGNSPRGVFVTFEGGDGAGKTTHIRFLANALSAMGREVVCLREPGAQASASRFARWCSTLKTARYRVRRSF